MEQLFITSLLITAVSSSIVVRPNVVTNRWVSNVDHDRSLKSKQDEITSFAFVVREGKLLCQEQSSGSGWTKKWTTIPSGAVKGVLSNPAVYYNPKSNATQVFVLGADGQVLSTSQSMAESTGCTSFIPLTKLSLPDLQFNASASLIGQDNVIVIPRRNELYIFVRSHTTKPELLYTIYNGLNCSAWFNVGGHLYSDATVVLNPFSDYFEAFAFGESGKLKRVWQYDDKSWAKWRVCGDSQPKLVPTHRPSAHSMSPTIFNGMTEVFALGTDGKIHHIWQTTCDHVKNPWGYCTWGLWYSIGSAAPSAMSTINNFGVGNNVHLGNEIFAMDNKGSFWHLWQLQRDGSWHGWEVAARVQGYPSVNVASLPYIRNTEGGWWQAYVLVTGDAILELSQNRTLTLSSPQVKYGADLTVSWSVPQDEATHMDWIGIYPHGQDNQKYVDYRYVQGTQNPKKEAIPNGKISMTSFLTDGSYDVRYLVNRKFVSTMTTVVTYADAPTEPEWVLLYRGIARAMGADDVNITACVKDGELTVQKFRSAFDAFENREVFKALELFGQGLKDVQVTLQQCGKTKIVERLEKFVKDLIACTEANCVSFVIDLIEEIVILYEDIYEIFGDIRAASNSLKIIKAYEQAGLCIGRVVAACISLPK